MVLKVPDVNFRKRSPILFTITVAILTAARLGFRRWHLATLVANRACIAFLRRHVVRTLFVGRSALHKDEFDAIDDFHNGLRK